MPHPPAPWDALHGHSLKAYCGSPVAKPDFRHNCPGLRRAGHGGQHKRPVRRDRTPQ